MSKATGASALFGIAIDAPSDLYAIGHPQADIGVVGIPDISSMVVATGAAGNLTGDFAYRVAYGTRDGALTNPSLVATTVAAESFTGSGLDDLTSGGTYTGSADAVYTVTIDSTGTPDTYKWRKDSGAWTEDVNIVGGAVALSLDVEITFAATTGHTLGDSWSIAATLDKVTAAADKVELTVIPASGTSKVDRRVIERTGDGGLTWAICGAIYNNSATIFTDNVATLDTSKVIPSLNQTGANYGYTFVEPDSFDLEPDFTNLPVMALLGTAGKPRSIPGPIKFTGSPKSDMRPAELLPVLLAGAGAPDSYTQVAGEPVFIGTWAATTGKRNPRTISALTYDGSENVVPNFLYQLACEELSIGFSGGKITDITPKFTGANYGISAPAAYGTHTGTWAGTFVTLGQRYDAGALTDSLYIKITDNLAAGIVKFVTRVSATDTGAYGTTKYNLYVDADSDRQTKGGLQYNDAIELSDQNDIRLGADAGSNRQPFTLLATKPIVAGDLLVNDVYVIPPTTPIPGVLSGDTPELYSGVPARFASGPRFTDAHVTIIQDGSVIEATAGTLKFKWPKKEVNALCAGARTIQDLPNEGFFGVDLTITRFLDSSGNQNMIRTDERAVVRVELEGERIPIIPGTLSTYREALYVDLPQVAFTSVKSPVAGQVLVTETIVGEAEQPDNPASDLYELELVSRQGWSIPS